MSRTRKPTGYWTVNRSSQQARGLVGLWGDAGVSSANRWRNLARTSYNDAAMTGFPTPFTTLAGWQSGVDGGRGAVRFNGAQDMTATMPTITTAGFSVTLWAQWTSSGTTTVTIVALVDNAHDTGKGFVIQDRPDLSKALSFFVGGSSSVESTFQVGDGTWRHIACTYDGTNARMYINGQLNNTAVTTSGVLQTNITFGRSVNFGRFLAGTIEEPRLYNRVLSAADVRQMYSAQTRWAIRYQAARFYPFTGTSQPPPAGKLLTNYQAAAQRASRV